MSRTARDELLTPSLQESANVHALPPGERPWHLSSLFYPAFFGGALAVAVLAWMNSVRLDTPDMTRRWIVVIGTAGVVTSAVVPYLINGGHLDSTTQLGYRIVGALTFAAVYRVLRSANRLYTFRSPAAHEEMYDSLWAPGLTATLVLGALQLGIVFAGVAIIRGVAGS